MSIGQEGPSAIPRDYNFAADILKRNLDAGRAEKIAFIDHRGKYSYGDLAERVERFGHVLRSLPIRREERMLMCLLDTIDWPTAFLGAIKAGVVAGAGQHADDRGRLLLHAARQPRAASRRLRRPAAEIRQSDPRVGGSRTHHRLRRTIARPAAL